MTEAVARRLVTVLERETGMSRNELWPLVLDAQNITSTRRLVARKLLKPALTGKQGRPKKPIAGICVKCLKRRQSERLRKRRRYEKRHAAA